MTDARPRVALFDFDGTLVDTTELIFQSMKHAVGEILGQERPREELMENVGQPLPVQMKVFSPDHVDDLLESYRVYNDEVHETYIRQYPGVPDALGRLREAGIKVGVVTSKRRHSVELALDSFPEFRGVVDCFVTMEDTQKHKPDPEPLLKGLELLGGGPDDAPDSYYVGDATFDVWAAKAAGMRSIAVSWGVASEEKLRSSSPDHLVPDVPSAVDIILAESGS